MTTLKVWQGFLIQEILDFTQNNFHFESSLLFSNVLKTTNQVWALT